MRGFSIDAQGPGNVHNLELGRFEFGIIRRKVGQIIGQAGFTFQDREDLEQELLTRLIQSLKSFDPAQAHRNAFVTAVVERDVASILRDARAAKRDHRRRVTLKVSASLADQEGSSDPLNELSEDARRPSTAAGTAELIDLCIDLRSVLEKLPVALREFACARMSKTMTELARESAVPRTSLYHLVPELRQHLEAAGLRDYVAKVFGHTSG
jgi:DNA-directed RNA polymerase specialized sigma24 family protein